MARRNGRSISCTTAAPNTKYQNMHRPLCRPCRGPPSARLRHGRRDLGGEAERPFLACRRRLAVSSSRWHRNTRRTGHSGVGRRRIDLYSVWRHSRFRTRRLPAFSSRKPTSAGSVRVTPRYYTSPRWTQPALASSGAQRGCRSSTGCGPTRPVTRWGIPARNPSATRLSCISCILTGRCCGSGSCQMLPATLSRARHVGGRMPLSAASIPWHNGVIVFRDVVPRLLGHGG